VHSLHDGALSAQAYRTIVDLVYEHSRINLGQDKQTLLSNRLGKRLKHLGIASYDEYCERLKSLGAQEEIEHLVDLISTNHTRFYREPDHFTYLTEKILPGLIPKLHAERAPLRIWSAASSSGEEPYTLAIVLAEYLRAHQTVNWKIEASDISRSIIAKAERAIYRMDAVEPVPLELLKRYFQKGVGEFDGHCRVRPELRERVRYARVNLFQPDYPISPKQHVIFCRNVMIYFDKPTQTKVLNQFLPFMKPHALLFFGHSENFIYQSEDLRLCGKTVYELKR